jgi:capsular exopolysaccharide synthesis family protein
MEIRQYIDPLLKWWKLILLACLLAGISSYLLVRQQPPIFQTRTTLVIGRAVYEPNPSPGELSIATQLAGYYADIAKRDTVQSATKEALGLDWLPEYVVQVIPNTQLIEIIVTDANPQRAQVVANELANQLTKQSPSNEEFEEVKHQEFINEQLQLLESQITATLDEIGLKDEELGGLTSAREIETTQGEIQTLQQKLLLLQSNYANLLSSSTGRGLNSLSVVEPALLPTKPVGPNSSMTILLSIAVAFAISSGAAYLIEYLDDTFKTPDEITRHLGLPVIGHVAYAEKNPVPGVYVEQYPNSVVAEAFRSICLNLDFIEPDKEKKLILVSSVGPQDGKTFFATNLAMALSESGKQVVLMDADLRRPNIHNTLGQPNDKGLSDIIRGELSLDEAIDTQYHDHLSVITSGSDVSSPSGIFGSQKMASLLVELKSKADIVVLDGTPIPVTDSRILATKVDAVLMVIRYGKTRRSTARELIKQIGQVDAKVAGVIFNGIPKNKSYYKTFHYYYEQQEGGKNSLRSFKLPLPNIFQRNLNKLRRADIPEQETQTADSN